MAALKSNTSDEHGCPRWAQLSKAESRNLWKPERARESMRFAEKWLLNNYRKLNSEQRMDISLLANSLALERIRARLERDRERKRRWPANVVPLRPRGQP